MAQTHFDQFLNEATYKDQEAHSTLDGDPFYGLYTSWCYVSGNSPEPEHIFWEAIRRRVDPRHRLRMKGPAAADYILASYGAVV
ncbi:MAG: hypothetical protein ABWY04_02175 [Arthrobacter sp.]